MNMQSRNQYLVELRTECLKTKSKKERGKLLDEAKKNPAGAEISNTEIKTKK
jgi:hypothetical protein